MNIYTLNINNRTTPDHITELKSGQIFVYGANSSWAHGAGAAKLALKFGAIYGEGPFCGKTYGICTKDKNIQTLPLQNIRYHIHDFVEVVEDEKNLQFLVTKVGCGLANLSIEDIAPLFISCVYLPNVSLPKEFWGFYEDSFREHLW